MDTWKAMMELYRNGKVRAIGISNFMPHHMEALLDADMQTMDHIKNMKKPFDHPDEVPF